MNRRKFLVMSGLGLLVINDLLAQRDYYSDKEILEILRHRIDIDKMATGMAVGIIKVKDKQMVVYGHQDSVGSKLIGKNTLFEIGSITKVFTSLLLAEMVYHNELHFDDPVEKHLSADFKIPQRNGRKITLIDLATHTSGLPLFPVDMFTNQKADKVFEEFTLDKFKHWLSEFLLTRDPGADWEYSNLGYALLGLALAYKNGTSFEVLLKNRLLKPLGLKNTCITTTEDIKKQMAVGHDPNLGSLPRWHFGVFAPAGGALSTVADQLKFMNAVMPNSKSKIEKAAQLLLSRKHPAPDVGGEQALGWDVVFNKTPFLAKDGVTNSQTASMVLDTKANHGVIVLSNTFPIKLGKIPSGGVGAADLARHLLRPEISPGTR